jgi:hypothetical protein
MMGSDVALWSLISSFFGSHVLKTSSGAQSPLFALICEICLMAQYCDNIFTSERPSDHQIYGD